MAITSWSYSKHSDFARCKFACWLKHDQKIPEPERELRPGQTEHANDRGSRIHDAAEQFVRGLGPFPIEMNEFKADLTVMRDLFPTGAVHLEGEWGMSEDWEPVPWTGAWLRLKLDALVFLSKTEAVVIDYKTGKKWGNEVKHAEQTQLYALATFLRHPMLEVAHTELWYPDVKELTLTTYTREKALLFRRTWDKKGTDLTTCTKWPPNPNRYSCCWCQYGSWGTGHCPVGVKK